MSYKSIPGNNDYIISLNCDIRLKNGNIANLNMIDDKVQINLFGEETVVQINWLSLLSHFEVESLYTSVKKLFNIYFVSNNINLTKSKSGKIMLFYKPEEILFNNKIFRVIPNFVRYAISKEGEVLEIKSNRFVKILYDIKRHHVKDNYPSVYIYDPERVMYRYIYVHRLVAMAWIRNDDYVLSPIVNHKDGDKNNFKSSNLEWLSFSDNNYHAVNYGLRKDNILCKIRDFFTGEITTFNSLRQASQYMGLKSRVLIADEFYKRKAKLISGKYEIKLLDDDTPWFYEIVKEKVPVGRYVILVEYPNSDLKYFYDLRDFRDEFSVWNCPNANETLSRARHLYPDHKFSITDNFNSNPIQAFDVRNDKILETKTIAEMSKVTNVTEGKIRKSLLTSETLVKDGYAFRYKTDRFWDKTTLINYEKPKIKVIAENKLTKEIVKLNSLREAAKFFNCDRSKIKNSIINDILLNNTWKLKECESNLIKLSALSISNN